MPAEYPPTNNEARMKKVPVYVDLLIGVGAAVVASGCVTPFVLTIDKAFVQAAAGSIKLGPALVGGVVDLMKKPGKMLMSVPLWLVWACMQVPTLQPTQSTFTMNAKPSQQTLLRW